jgi:glycosyltransferase involved in cell wall biosynthesis
VKMSNVRPDHKNVASLQGAVVSDRLFVHATNVHQGGGRALLDALLRALPSSTETHVLLDSRMPMLDGMPEGICVKRVRPSVIERFKAERWLAENVRSGDIVLCFGNLPPLFKLCGRAVVFLQNRFLIDYVRLDAHPLKSRVRLGIERLWLSNRMANADEIVVQTPTMKNLLEARTQGRVPVRVLPFMAEFNGYARSAPQAQAQRRESCEFLYVAHGEPHKNHRRLIEAWGLLAEEGRFPSLRLTLDEALFRTLCREIEEMRQRYGLKVTNMGVLSHGDVLALYKDVDALIYPSTFESFGLPLIEARQEGLPVITSELDYVRDVCSPAQTFDPTSPVSIARAVKRFLAVSEPALQLRSPQEFWRELLGATSE